MKGWVACGKDGKWRWYSIMPAIENGGWGLTLGVELQLLAFNIKPVKDWWNSLMRCGL